MTSDELEALVREIRRGRSEGDSLEWKRQWWNLASPEGKAEFRRDIASLANSADPAGVLVVGLKNGRLYEAPPPLDEAELQQILDVIIPTPSVVIETLTVEGTTVSVLTVSPPFDRPYVAPLNSLNVVFVRHGSSIDTATRFELDTFYRSQERQPNLVAEWQSWPPSSFAKGSDESLRSSILRLTPPPVRPEGVRPMFEARLRTLRESHSREGYPTRDQLQDFEQKLALFLACLDKPENLLYWYVNNYWHSTAIPFTAVFHNNGTAPATDLKLRVEFPTWVYVFGKVPKSAPEGYVPPPPAPPRPKPPLSPYEAFMQSLESRVPDFLRFTPPVLPTIHATSGASVHSRARRITFWAKRLLHAHLLDVDDTVYALALPDATPASPMTLPASIFSAEQERWLPIDLQIQVAQQP